MFKTIVLSRTGPKCRRQRRYIATAPLSRSWLIPILGSTVTQTHSEHDARCGKLTGGRAFNYRGQDLITEDSRSAELEVQTRRYCTPPSIWGRPGAFPRLLWRYSVRFCFVSNFCDFELSQTKAISSELRGRVEKFQPDLATKMYFGDICKTVFRLGTSNGPIGGDFLENLDSFLSSVIIWITEDGFTNLRARNSDRMFRPLRHGNGAAAVIMGATTSVAGVSLALVPRNSTKPLILGLSRTWF